MLCQGLARVPRRPVPSVLAIGVHVRRRLWSGCRLSCRLAKRLHSVFSLPALAQCNTCRGSRHCSPNAAPPWRSTPRMPSVCDEGGFHLSLESVSFSPPHSQGRRIERLSVPTLGAFHMPSIPCEVPAGDRQVQTRRVSSPSVLQSSTSSSQNVHTHQLGSQVDARVR